ncbi:MAG: peptide deformylase [Bdellovibrionales bacterium]|nr:peptide deformylase [Bdellovibrionales bacterium]
MAKLPIVKYPDTRLYEICEEVTEFDQNLGRLLDDMVDTMYHANGVGLAAPQIGVLKRITVIDVSEDGSGLTEFVNPVITKSIGNTSSEEGCLSIPDYRDSLKRNTQVTVEAQNRNGEKFSVEADELFAICLQHEIDHLDGILFVDKLSRLKKNLFKSWYKKHGPFE